MGSSWFQFALQIHWLSCSLIFPGSQCSVGLMSNNSDHCVQSTKHLRWTKALLSSGCTKLKAAGTKVWSMQPLRPVCSAASRQLRQCVTRLELEGWRWALLRRAILSWSARRHLHPENLQHRCASAFRYTGVFWILTYTCSVSCKHPSHPSISSTAPQQDLLNWSKATTYWFQPLVSRLSTCSYSGFLSSTLQCSYTIQISNGFVHFGQDSWSIMFDFGNTFSTLVFIFWNSNFGLLSNTPLR